ncbi:hypothetical protein D3C85_1331830 [compost metagenome]
MLVLIFCLPQPSLDGGKSHLSTNRLQQAYFVHAAVQKTPVPPAQNVPCQRLTETERLYHLPVLTFGRDQLSHTF